MNLTTVVTDSISAWRRVKHPRLAAIADWASARALAESPRPALPTGAKKADSEAWQARFDARDALDVPRLLAAVGTSRSSISSERVARLATLDDPRVVTGLLRLLETPPFRAGTAQPFFRACAKALAESGDPRVKPALEDLAARYKGIIETSIGDVIAALLARTAGSIDAVPVPALPAELEARCAAWESHFEAERATAASATRERRAAKASDDELLAAVYAAPGDDGPRHVFADALLERGDARGEFILLQLAKARGDASPEQLVRERELQRDARRLAAWGLPLSAAGDVTFARGFPTALVLGAKQGKKAAGCEALRTLERLENLQGVSKKLAVELLSSPQLAGLQHAGQLEAALFDAVPGTFGWTSAALSFAPSPGQLARLPRLTTLALTTTEGFSGSATLETLVTHQAHSVDPALLAALPRLVAFTATQRVHDWTSAGRFDALPRVERLSFRNAPPPALLQGCGATSLDCFWTRELDLPGVLAALPKLRRLALLGNYTPADVRAVAVDAARARGFERLGLGMVAVERPFTDSGVIELQLSSFEVDQAKEVLATLPRDLARRLVVRRPSRFAPAPAPEVVASVAAVLGLPTEVAWY